MGKHKYRRKKFIDYWENTIDAQELFQDAIDRIATVPDIPEGDRFIEITLSETIHRIIFVLGEKNAFKRN